MCDARLIFECFDKAELRRGMVKLRSHSDALQRGRAGARGTDPEPPENLLETMSKSVNGHLLRKPRSELRGYAITAWRKYRQEASPSASSPL